MADKPKSVQFLDMKNAQAAQTSGGLVSSIGRFIGNRLKEAEEFKAAGDADYRAGYDNSRAAGNAPAIAMLAGAVNQLRGSVPRNEKQLIEMKDGLSSAAGNFIAGFETGHNATTNTKPAVGKVPKSRLGM